MRAAARRFHATFLSGWWRWPREHYQVLVGHDPAHLHPVRAPFGCYYADPFPWTQAGRTWLFLEEFHYSLNRARLVALPLDGRLRPAGPAVPLAVPIAGHASYPLVFTVAGELLLLPETTEQGTVDLYACERFPDRWRLRRRLLDGIDAADVTPLFQDGRWWLFASVRAQRSHGGRRSLALYSSTDLFHGTWTPHPVNAERLYGESEYTYGRPAGPFVHTDDGRCLRPMQASRRYYGESSRWMEVEVLTATTFRERPLAGAHPWSSLDARYSPHHLAAHAGVFACDVRDRFFAGRPAAGN